MNPLIHDHRSRRPLVGDAVAHKVRAEMNTQASAGSIHVPHRMTDIDDNGMWHNRESWYDVLRAFFSPFPSVCPAKLMWWVQDPVTIVLPSTFCQIDRIVGIGIRALQLYRRMVSTNKSSQRVHNHDDTQEERRRRSKHCVVATVLLRSVPPFFYAIIYVAPKKRSMAEHVVLNAQKTLTVTLQRCGMSC